MTIEYLTKPKCEPSEAMLPRVVDVLGHEGFVSVDMMQLPMDDVRRGYDTPTLLVDGVDVFGSVPRTDFSVPPN
jgi:hypothetical protein